MKNNRPKKRSKEEHRQYLQQKKQQDEIAQKERQDEIWTLHRKALSVKPGDIIFSTEQDLFKIWGVSILCFSIIVFTVYMLSLMNTKELISEFGSVLKGRLFQIGMTIFSSLMFLSICYFLHNRYVLTITLLADNEVQIKTWGLFGYKKAIYPNEAWITPPIYHQGKAQFANTPSVYAPYQSIKPYGKKKLIMSEFGNFPFGAKVLDDILNPS